MSYFTIHYLNTKQLISNHLQYFYIIFQINFASKKILTINIIVMANFYGQIDLTKLSNIVKKHPSLIKKVTFKDGREHKLLNISVVNSLYDNHGFDKAIRINHNKNEHVASLNYYVGDLKKIRDKKDFST